MPIQLQENVIHQCFNPRGNLLVQAAYLLAFQSTSQECLDKEIIVVVIPVILCMSFRPIKSLVESDMSNISKLDSM